MYGMIETDRLVLRSWRPSDLQPFAAMNADPRVCEFLPKVLTAQESDGLADRIVQHFDKHGLGLWAVELKANEQFIGFTGLYFPSFEAHFTPCVEIGWRLAFAHWRKGYATEAAIAAKAYAFTVLKLKEIVAYTAAINFRSRAVMERIAMTRDPADTFDHPSLPRGHRLASHVLYRCRGGSPRSNLEPPHFAKSALPSRTWADLLDAEERIKITGDRSATRTLDKRCRVHQLLIRKVTGP